MSTEDAKTLPDGDPWADCTFEGAELATLRQGAKLTFAEKIAWLEDMHRMALQFQETRRKKGLRTIYPDGRIEN
jgi:hypothetical protein